MSKSKISVLVLICAFFLISLVIADTLYVPQPYQTIQSAIDAAATSGDTIQVEAPGPYNEDLNINKSVGIIPTGPVDFIYILGDITIQDEGSLQLEGFAVGPVYAPSITVVEPDGTNDITDSAYTIIWTDEDLDDNATISIYYDTDNSGEDGILIVSGLGEDDADQYLWDTTGIPEGDYYIYAVIDDGLNTPVVDYSAGVVTIVHTMQPGFKLTASDADISDEFGYSVSIDGDYAVVGVYRDDDSGSNSGSAYIYKRDGVIWTEQAKLTAGDGAEYDYFGNSVSISGEYAIVGAYKNDDSGSDSGSAYIFKRNGTSWTEEARLGAGDAASNDYFGDSVSINGEYAIIGAYRDDYGGYNSGSAYIFKRNGTVWTEQAKLGAGDASGLDCFGISVSLNGNHAVVGAYKDDDGGSNSGSAYIFKRDGAIWTEQTKLIAGDGASVDYFGISVSTSGDYAIVGAHKDENGAGSAYIYPILNAHLSADPSTMETGESATLTWSSIAADSATIDNGIGSVGTNGSVTVSPVATTSYTITVTGPDGTATASAVVNVVDPSVPPAVDINASPSVIMAGEFSTLTWSSGNASSAHIDQGIGPVFVNGSTTVSPVTSTTYTITVTGPGGTATADASVTVTYPLPDVVINASPETIQTGESSTLSWTSTNADSVAIDQGIGTVALNGSMTITPAETTLYTITATGPGGTATSQVSLVVSPLPSITVIEPDGTDDTADGSFTIKWIDAHYASDAGISLYYDTDNMGADGTLIVSGLSEDPDGEGNDDYVWDTALLAQGVYYVYAVIDDNVHTPVVDYSSGPVSIAHSLPGGIKLIPGDGAAYDNFGRSVSISGKYAIIGAYQDDDTGSGSGSAYIFKRDGSIWTQQAKLTAGDGAGSDYFGNSVSIDGEYAIVGAYQDDDTGSGSGSVYIFKRDGSTWTQQAKLTAVDGANGDQFGYSVSISGEYAIAGAYDDDDNGYSSGSAYIFKRDASSWTQQAKLSAGDAAGNDYFGNSVSINGEYAIVGAYQDDDSGSGSGSAYIFKRDGSSWTEQAKLIAGDGASGDQFGNSVSINGDYVIIGAHNNDGSGSAYIFKGDGAIWTEQAKLIAGDAASSDYFGCSVSIDGEYAIAGAYQDDDSGSKSGSAYIFKRDGAAWTEQAKLIAGDGAAYDYFGYSVSLSEGYAIAGSYSDDASGSGSGSAYVHQFLYVDINAAPEVIELGGSATLSWSTALADSCVIGPGPGPVALNGSMAVSPVETTTYTITATGLYGLVTGNITIHVVDPSSPPSVDLSADPQTITIGGSTVLSWNSTNADSCSIQPDIGDVDLQGSIIATPVLDTTYTISADNSGHTSTQNVSVSVGPSISIIEPDGTLDTGDTSYKIQWDDYGTTGNTTISLYYDVDDSGEDGTLIVGGLDEAPDGAGNDEYIWDTGAMPEGQYFVYAVIADNVHDPMTDYSAGMLNIVHTIHPEFKLTAGDAATSDYFGYSVSISGYYAIIGAKGDDDNGNGSGSAYIFKRDGATWTEQTKLSAGDGATYDCFGSSVSIDGDYAIVGAYKDDYYGGNDSGSAYIFKRDGSTWTQQAKLNAGDRAASDYFGYSVSIDGDYAIVGAYKDDYYGENDSGSAYIFKRDGSTWTQQAKLNAGDRAASDYFGYSVSISGEYVLIGAYRDGYGSGSAYIFKRNGATWTEQAKLTGGDAAYDARFGISVAMDDDYAVIGANKDAEGGVDTGAAYIFKRDGVTWTQQARLIAGDAAASDYFGYSVSISGACAIIGAYYDDDHGSGSGSAYIFRRDGATWTEQDKLTAGDAAASDNFGYSVAMDGGYAIMGAPYDDDDGNASGSAYIRTILKASLDADPETIMIGESTTLTWTSANADTCIIEPDMGSVGFNGSSIISPAKTTKYTMTATGPGGAITDSVTITVWDPIPAPPSGLNTIPGTGEILLTWNPNTESDLTGYNVYRSETAGGPYTKLTSPPITAAQYQDTGLTDLTTYYYVVTAMDTDVNESAYSDEVPGTPGLINITSPADASTVNSGSVCVTGTVSQDAAYVTVNGVSALLANQTFMAHGVILDVGVNTISAIATDSAGLVLSMYTITVTADNTDDYVTLQADTLIGTAPMNVNLSLSSSLSNGISGIQWDFDGDGTIDQTGGTSHQTIYNDVRIYHPVVIVTDNNNIKYSGTQDINIHLAPATIHTSGNGALVHIAKDGSHNLYVLDSGGSTVFVIDRDCNPLRSFGVQGSGDGELLNPMGIALDKDGNIYIADTGNHRIQVFDNSGVYQYKFGVQGSGNGEFNQPFDIAVTNDGDIYVTDMGNNRVQVFDNTGAYKDKWGVTGPGDGQFNAPKGIHVTSIGDVYVADSGNNRVQKFTSSGSYEEAIIGLNNPHDVALNSNFIYVADTGNIRICKYKRDDSSLNQVATSDLTGPASLVAGDRLDKETVYVIDSGLVKEVEFPIIYPDQVWNAMKQALINGDIEQAVSYIAESSREMYLYNFNLMSAYVPAIGAGLQNISLVEIRGEVAEYEMWAEQDGQTYSFYILFVRDLNGIWQIEFF
ncbi:MAG: hypothetical protein GY845_38335 [Planctomycetes bacterium]|nr:hypothetical protein [Planctomycetota bacterium]